MFITVRRYEVLDEDLTPQLVAARVEQELMEEFEAIDGFREYYFVESHSPAVTTVTVCDTREAVEESNRVSMEWVLRTYGSEAIRRIDVTSGETLIARSLVGHA